MKGAYDSDKLLYDMAQGVHRLHCDRKDRPHDCVGKITITRGEIAMECQVCGSGTSCPGWNATKANRLAEIFSAAGIEWESLTFEAQLNAIAAMSRQEAQA